MSLFSILGSFGLTVVSAVGIGHGSKINAVELPVESNPAVSNLSVASVSKGSSAGPGVMLENLHALPDDGTISLVGESRC